MIMVSNRKPSKWFIYGHGYLHQFHINVCGRHDRLFCWRKNQQSYLNFLLKQESKVLIIW